MAVIDQRRPKAQKNKGNGAYLGIAAANTGMGVLQALEGMRARREQGAMDQQYRQQQMTEQAYDNYVAERDKVISTLSQMSEKIAQQYGYGSPQYKQTLTLTAQYMDRLNAVGGAVTPAGQIEKLLMSKTQATPMNQSAYDQAMQTAFAASALAGKQKGTMSRYYQNAAAITGNVLQDAYKDINALRGTFPEPTNPAMTASDRIAEANVELGKNKLAFEQEQFGVESEQARQQLALDQAKAQAAFLGDVTATARKGGGTDAYGKMVPSNDLLLKTLPPDYLAAAGPIMEGMGGTVPGGWDRTADKYNAGFRDLKTMEVAPSPLQDPTAVSQGETSQPALDMTTPPADVLDQLVRNRKNPTLGF